MELRAAATDLEQIHHQPNLHETRLRSAGPQCVAKYWSTRGLDPSELLKILVLIIGVKLLELEAFPPDGIQFYV